MNFNRKDIKVKWNWRNFKLIQSFETDSERIWVNLLCKEQEKNKINKNMEQQEPGMEEENKKPYKVSFVAVFEFCVFCIVSYFLFN